MSRLKFSYRSARLSVVFPVLAAMVLLGACGEKKETGTTQVAAKVNSDEITVHQLEFVLRSQQRSLPPEQIEAASRLLLEQMIDQQLQMQKAQSEKLDRDPEVVQRLDAARRDILATRYLEKVTEKVGTPTEDAIKKYYASRPAIFADRKIFTFQRLDIAAPPARRDDIVTRVEAAQSATELSDWLKAQDLRYGASPMTQPAESLPSSVLEKVLSLKEGQSLALPQPMGVMALTLTAVQAVALSYEQARGQIEQALTIEMRRTAVKEETGKLRQQAKIEYEGRFAASAPSSAQVQGISPAPSAATAASAPMQASSTAAGPSSAASAASSAASALDADMLRRGLGK